MQYCRILLDVVMRCGNDYLKEHISDVLEELNKNTYAQENLISPNAYYVNMAKSWISLRYSDWGKLLKYAQNARISAWYIYGTGYQYGRADLLVNIALLHINGRGESIRYMPGGFKAIDYHRNIPTETADKEIVDGNSSINKVFDKLCEEMQQKRQ